MNKCHFTIIISCVQSTLRNSESSEHSVNIRTNSAFGNIEYSCHFTSLHDYHVVCSIPTSEHSVNFWTNSVFGKIRPSDNCRCRTYVILHCLNKFEFFIIFCLRHVFTMTFVIIRYTKSFSKYPSYRSVDCNTCKNDGRLQLRAKMNCRGYSKLCPLTNAPPVQSTHTGQWLSTLFHANCSAAQVYVLYPRQFIFAPSCRPPSFLQVLQSTER